MAEQKLDQDFTGITRGANDADFHKGGSPKLARPGFQRQSEVSPAARKKKRRPGMPGRRAGSYREGQNETEYPTEATQRPTARVFTPFGALPCFRKASRPSV